MYILKKYKNLYQITDNPKARLLILELLMSLFNERIGNSKALGGQSADSILLFLYSSHISPLGTLKVGLGDPITDFRYKWEELI